MESCRPAWAEVLSRDESSVRVRGPVLALSKGKLTLDEEAERTLSLDPAILPGLRTGDAVSVHWSHPALILTSRQAEALARYTRRSLDAANEALPRLRALA
jgi:hypothetical protein